MFLIVQHVLENHAKTLLSAPETIIASGGLGSYLFPVVDTVLHGANKQINICAGEPRRVPSAPSEIPEWGLA
jgi:hypothetical protein